jgi:hypothetical protein
VRDDDSSKPNEALTDSGGIVDGGKGSSDGSRVADGSVGVGTPASDADSGTGSSGGDSGDDSNNAQMTGVLVLVGAAIAVAIAGCARAVIKKRKRDRLLKRDTEQDEKYRALKKKFHEQHAAGVLDTSTISTSSAG